MFCFSGLPVGDDVEDLLDLGFDCIVAIESSTQVRVSASVIPIPAKGHRSFDLLLPELVIFVIMRCSGECPRIFRGVLD